MERHAIQSTPRSLVLLVATVLLGMISSLPFVNARLDFVCEFGSMESTTTSDGRRVEFCRTHMDPAFMTKGDFIVARKNDACYECVCEEDIGLACCECPRRRRG
ncbi:unnamed protein product [Lymnaea stagnalis]|uniref:Uncharacterized protein n=1 Tax=Lymnaea stagnalis TaxID=6523 RepID=A0AAV2GYA1_LYMST